MNTGMIEQYRSRGAIMSFETTITRNIIEYLNSKDGVIVEKVKGEAECSGRADINGCYKGRSIRIEVKTPDNRNKPSKKQLWNLWEWHRAGAITIVTYSLLTVQIAFDIWDRSKHKPEDNLIIQEENNCTSLVVFPNNHRTFKDFYLTYYS